MVSSEIERNSFRDALQRTAVALAAGEGPHALRFLPDDALLLAETAEVPTLLELAGLYHRARCFEPAEEAYQRILTETEHPLALINLGHLYHFTGRLDSAIAMRRRALALSPQDAGLRRDLGCSLMFVGDKREGISLLREAALSTTDMDVASTYLFRLHHDDSLDCQVLFERHREWARRFAPVRPRRFPIRPNATSKRPLRIGYLSPDFRTHPVAFFFESLLDGHDSGAVEVYGYGDVACPDETTERMQPKFKRYHSIQGLDDQTVVRQIERDGIDILVDLAGHTGGHRLGVFAWKPAPIQVTYCGYPDTTGMTQIDYRLVDALSTPLALQRYHTETLVHLPETFLCYRPSELAPPVTAPPREDRGYVTFGVFNNTSKVNDPLIRTWAELLRSIPASKLLFKSRAGDDERVCARFLEKFKAQGIPPARIQFAGQVALVAYYRQLAQVDIVLDTFPYHGTTTTCDALWMGVPVLTRLGLHHASRVGLSLLSQVGMDFCVARTEQEYIDKAGAIARDKVSLAKIRRTLRARMEASPLCRPRRFAAHVEAAYREMWSTYCKGPARNNSSLNPEPLLCRDT